MAIQEHTLELAIIELNRCLKVLKSLRDKRARAKAEYENQDIYKNIAESMRAVEAVRSVGPEVKERVVSKSPLLGMGYTNWHKPKKEHAAALRASMDATRILADLRQGR